ncbi:DDE-type integrase/transposase/recombinase [Amphritea sp.]|uniref:DDE-type integrase/transposase/recombinase n=1 Tax=Amphritea sp. TaxID=1872502 RepID=UPI003A91A351
MFAVYRLRYRDGKTAKRFFRRLLQSHVSDLRKIVTDKLRSYGVAHRELIFETITTTRDSLPTIEQSCHINCPR